MFRPAATSRTAFVLSGGGSLGALQVGMLQALLSAGVRPDLIVGSSVGSVNGAWIAAGPVRARADQLAALWLSTVRDDVFHLNPLDALRGLIGSTNHLLSNQRLRRLLESHLLDARLEDTEVPLHVVTTDLGTGREVVLSKGPVVEALLASSAIPGVFPPVLIHGRQLVDGGIANHTPLSVAVALGAQRVYVLHARHPWSEAAARNPLAMAIHSISRLIEQRLAVEIAAFESDIDIRLMAGSAAIGISPLDFSHTSELICRGRRAAQRRLAERGPRPALVPAAAKVSPPAA